MLCKEEPIRKNTHKHILKHREEGKQKMLARMRFKGIEVKKAELKKFKELCYKKSLSALRSQLV